MELTDLFSRGTTLAEVPPEFHGMPFWKWRLDMLGLQATKHRAKLARELAEAAAKPKAKKTPAPVNHYGDNPLLD